MNEKVIKVLKKVDDLPTLPNVVDKIMQTVSNPKSSAQDVTKIISSDPVLATKVLKLVNSAFYGQFANKITTISRAVVVLGFEQVSMAASSLMLFEQLQNKDQKEELRELAISSFMSATSTT